MKTGKVDSAILIVLIAGIFWSFGVLAVRFIENTAKEQIASFIYQIIFFL